MISTQIDTITHSTPFQIRGGIAVSRYTPWARTSDPGLNSIAQPLGSKTRRSKLSLFYYLFSIQ
jgi:hypothetical protein